MVPRETRSGMFPVFVLNRISPAYRRAHRAGFEFGPIHGEFDFVLRYWTVSWSFTCVCGRREWAKFVAPEYVMLAGEVHSPYVSIEGPVVVIDCAAMLEAFGAFGEDHLRQDGYSQEEIARIREPWVLQS